MSMGRNNTAVPGSFYLMFLGMIFSTLVVWRAWGKSAALLAITLTLLVYLFIDLRGR